MTELPTLSRSTQRTARKQHQCTECRQPIEPGEEYLDCASLCDGHWSSYRLCLACNAWAVATLVMYEGWTLGELANTIAEKFDRTPYDPDIPRHRRERVYYVPTDDHVPTDEKRGGQDGPQEEAATHLR